MYGREVIKRGGAWRIGLGKSIHIWGDNWLPKRHKAKIISPMGPGGDTALVSELIDPVNRTWRDEVIDRMFLECEAAVIKNIPLCRTIQDNVLIWPFNPDGEYLVKSGYRFTTKNGVFRLRFFRPRFKKRGPKLHKAPFFKNGA